MATKWTQDQLKVIQTRESNILVSAAAGSGKTAVLVERIIERITDEKNPIDIDHMLIVTFTKAAAAEMRERISNALEDMKQREPENEALERQLTLVHNAQIATIDSFCQFVVRNHFEEIELDPNFRIAETGELDLLCDDVLQEVFEKNYEKQEADFLRLIDGYSKKGKDDAVKEMVLSIYKQANSASWPKEWIQGLADNYKVTSVEKLSDTVVMREICIHAKNLLTEAAQLYEEMYHKIEGRQEYQKLYDKLLSERMHFQKVEALTDYQSLAEWINFDFCIYPQGIKSTDKNQIKTLRDNAKNIVVELKKNYFSMSLDAMLEQIQRLQEPADTLIRLSLEFLDAMSLAKKKRHLLDFSDLEHFALQILVDENTKMPTETAKEFRKHYDEIMIDEYQDSNQVQEDILCAVSGVQEGRYNLFMVGDVKQSIYRFRMARPELFMEKYNTYSVEENEKLRRIDLHKNFRSREQVLSFCNDIFYKIMQKDVGSVAYDKDAALYPGAEYVVDTSMKAEVILYDKKQESVVDEIEDLNSQQIEAHIVAERIRQLMKTIQVKAHKDGTGTRPLKYSDIVILLRGLSGLGDTIYKTLQEAGIPVHMQSQSGYFSTYEIQTIMYYLMILDNPYQDIPMAAVLKSPIVGISDEELAELGVSKDGFSYEVVKRMKEEDGFLYDFGRQYESFRQRVSDTPIHELLKQILQETGFGDYISCMPGGEKRSANMAMLIEKAIAYEKTSYKGLFHFVRFIQKVSKYDKDGEAEMHSQNDDSVRIMTIHKSKGLEFPVVFLCGIGKKFNDRDTQKQMVLHSDLGMGLNEETAAPHIKRTCLYHTEIGKRLKRDGRGEELRVLYVALTRAKEKLILTGMVDDAEKFCEKAVGNCIEGQPISYAQRVDAQKYLDWIYPAMISYPEKYTIDWKSGDDIVIEQAKNLAEWDIAYRNLQDHIANASQNLIENFEKSFSYTYPYQVEAGTKSKYSVSELKHDSMLENFDREEGMAEVPEFLKQDKESYIPDFMKEDEAVQEKKMDNPGALRGTAVHRVLECMDFAAALTTTLPIEDYVKSQMEQMLTAGKITEDMAKLVSVNKISRFLQSDVAKRMGHAQSNGKLFKEKPFVMQHEQGFLVQGIIDVFWFEEDRIILLDYKTDRVAKKEELVLRYKTQLDLYAQALQRIFSSGLLQMKSGENLIYSFGLQEVIEV